MPLDITNKIKRAFLAELERLACQVSPFHLLGAVAEQPNARPLHAEHFARINISHDRELQQMQRLALRRRAAVDQHKFAAWPRNKRSNGWPINSFEASQLERRRR